ncbi:ASCH domain-containing protein [Nocardioides acrostichi]|uniref:ASCH domain-containing protein n=1 Tax=Nocardioides acrostichi TaxID=2784339 RepID=A0A930Y7H9_9ACTN|nr:ASCH domain-containing protein [Nocardioides acrostichi]MBF4162021.1 ASCH domain-containing protein [Nocardioides acrostichi]
MSASDQPQRGPVEEFWEVARVHARLTNAVPAYFGPSALESLTPPAWAFGSSPEMADELLALVLGGTKTATASAHAWYTDDRPDDEAAEPLPAQGNLSIVLDGAGHPRALISCTSVEVHPFGEISEEHAYLEGEADRSLASWREIHERFFREEGTWAPDMLVVCERFKVLHQE